MISHRNGMPLGSRRKVLSHLRTFSRSRRSNGVSLIAWRLRGQAERHEVVFLDEELTTRIAVEVGRFTDMASSGNFYFHNTESHYCLHPT